MAGKKENQEVTGGEELETGYFQEVRKYEDSLDQSIDSLQGSITMPSFTLGQSNDLQGSQGFQISNLTFSQGSDISSSHIIFTGQKNTSESGGNVINSGLVTSDLGHVTPGLSMQGNTLILQGNKFGTLNVIQPTDHSQIVLPSYAKEFCSGREMGGTFLKSETTDTGGTNEVFEGGSSDEKSGRCKTSPKRRGRKSRSTSSAGNEISIKIEAVPGPSPCRMDTSEQQQQSAGGDVGFKPSLLDEILTEKKLALMKSPAVIQFLQSQQQQQAREKSAMPKQSTNS